MHNLSLPFPKTSAHLERSRKTSKRPTTALTSGKRLFAKSLQAEHGIKSLSNILMKHLSGLGDNWHLYMSCHNGLGGDHSDTDHSKCLLLGGRRLNLLTVIPKLKGSGGTRAATAQIGPANERNKTK